MTSLCIRSFAKLNIALDVLGRRPDGYHNIESVVQAISLHDDVVISKRRDDVISVTTNDPSLPPGSGNLAYRACVMFLEAAGLSAGVNIEISKDIPAQAGLGGGSSNAAATVTGLNELFGNPLKNPKLWEICAALGSDAPLFLVGGTVFVSGRGEIVEPLPDMALDFVIVKPDVGVPTAWAYSRLEADRPLQYASRAVAQAVRTGDSEQVIRRAHNDFEGIVGRAFPEIASVWADISSAGADKALLAGSGSAVLGVFLDAERCDAAHDQLKALHPRVFRVRAMPRRESSLLGG